MRTEVLKGFSLIAGTVALMASASAQAEGDAAAGMVKFETCAGCHSRPGYANAYPRYHVPKLAGQQKSYIVSAIKAYADNQRKHGAMDGNADGLKPQDVEDIAAYLTQFELSENDETITGDAEAGKEKVASCSACHGKGGDSSDPNFPRLAGQYESYLVKALNDYKSGARNNPMMNGIAAGLNAEDILDISAFYASQEKGLSVVER
jgi:cytochrome c553